MFAKIAKFLGGSFVLLFAIFGVLVFVTLLIVASSKGQEKMKEKEREKPAAQFLADDCPCPSGVCVGPQGGRYCTEADGKKRYLKAQP